MTPPTPPTPPIEPSASPTGAREERRAELAHNLRALRDRVERACRDVRRDPAGITLVAVTKTYPASDVELLAELGVTDIGENRDKEAKAKARACALLGVTWHFIGQLQTNKARSVVRYADVVHSVDRARLVAALDTALDTELHTELDTRLDTRLGPGGRRVGCFVQVNLDAAAQDRGGAAPADVPEVAAVIEGARHLDLWGVMAVAPLGADPVPAFQRLAELSADLVRRFPAARLISAGMSGDFEAAIAAGATHLRVGAALLGARAPNR